MIVKLFKLIVAALLFAALASAQEVKVHMTDGAHTWWMPLPVVKRTADRSWFASSAVADGLMVADCENSQYALRKPGAHEANYLFGGHPTRLKCYAISAPPALILNYFSWRYKREDEAFKAAGYPPQHRFVKWFVPNLLTDIFHGVGVAVTLKSTGR